MHGAPPATFQKDALLTSKPNKPSVPSSPPSLDHPEVSKVSETVQEELTPSPQKAAPQGQSKSDPPKKKKDLVGENSKRQAVPSVSIVSSPLIVWITVLICVHFYHVGSEICFQLAI
jgi:hypothetical protein